MKFLNFVAVSVIFESISAKIEFFTPENSPRYVSVLGLLISGSMQ